jgi:hypothetical protein
MGCSPQAGKAAPDTQKLWLRVRQLRGGQASMQASLLTANKSELQSPAWAAVQSNG